MNLFSSWHLSAEFQISAFNYFLCYYMIVKPKTGIRLFVASFLGVSALKVFYIQYYNIDIWKSVLNFEL